MSNGNADQNVNSGLQLTDSEKAFLAKQMKEAEIAEAEAAKNKKRQEWLAEVKKSTGEETWNKLNSVKNSAGKTIMDVFQESPQLLDTPESTAVTIDLFKSYSNSNTQKAGDTAGVIEKGADPLKPSGNLGDGSVPKFNTPEFMESYRTGKISAQDIEKMPDINETQRLNLIVNLPKPQVNKARAAFI